MPSSAPTGGSSPLTRGLPATAANVRSGTGIIPARAGFTSRRPWPGGPGTDHPRSRGVYAGARVARFVRLGSSPLARGLPVGSGQPLVVVGIIPARAGFTSSPQLRSTTRPDHPRSRGVYRTRPSSPRRCSGSSPLARGLQDVADPGAAHRGIIPARAGFTPPSPPTRRTTWDHPRSRGVYGSSPVPFGWGSGSSPLARGLRQAASKTSMQKTDHPRSRGVYVGARDESPECGGSSPLARGLPIGSRGPVRIRRIIPARAGFTPKVSARRPR